MNIYDIAYQKHIEKCNNEMVLFQEPTENLTEIIETNKDIIVKLYNSNSLLGTYFINRNDL